MAGQAQNGVDRSATALGLGYKQWTRKQMAVILSHYGVRFAAGDTNNMLINSLNQLAAQRGLTREDRLAIIKAHKAGLNLPPRKLHVGRPIAVPTITQAADTLSATAQNGVLDNAHRSRRAAANRAGRPLTSQRWRDLAHSRIADPVSSTQATSGPPTLKTSQVINPECTICYNSFDPVKILMRQPTSSCVHEVNICKPCLSASISSQMKTELWTRISCPASTCKEFLGYDDIQEFAEPQDFAR